MSWVTRDEMAHEVLAVVFQVRRARSGGEELSVLLWQRAYEPHEGRWALPGGALRSREDLDASMRRQLAQKVDVRDVAHLEQLETLGSPDRHETHRVIATAYLGLVQTHATPEVPEDTCWHRADELPAMAFDHVDIVTAGLRRLRAKLSYTNVGFALAPPEFTMSQLCACYRAALGHEISVTNLQRVLLRRGQIEPTGRAVASGRHGGRPATVFRFRENRLAVTDEFAALRPPGTQRAAAAR